MTKQWVNVAEGTSFSNLKQLVKDQELPKGTQAIVKMKVGTVMAALFDAPLAEQLYGWAFAVPGMDVRDLRGEGDEGWVILESDPAWISDMVNYIVRFWGDVVIGGLKLIYNVFKIVITALIDKAESYAWDWFKEHLMWPSIAVGGMLMLYVMVDSGGKKEKVKNGKEN